MTKVPLEFYVEGFRGAADRFRGVRCWQHGFVALYEAVAWSGSLRQFINARDKDRARDDERVKRECPKLEGVYFVRLDPFR